MSAIRNQMSPNAYISLLLFSVTFHVCFFNGSYVLFPFDLAVMKGWIDQNVYSKSDSVFFRILCLNK